jgi:uncharacterized phage protein (TIGR02220 family)
MKVRIEWTPRRETPLETALADGRLSYRAKGLLAYMLSLPNDAAVDVKELAEASSEGKDAIGTALHELSVAGYCDRIEAVVEPVGPTPTDDAEETNTPVMDSLFGEAYGPPVPISELPDVRPRPAEDATESAVERIIDHLNDLRERSWDWAQYMPLSAKYAKNVEHIGGRLSDGYTEEDLILVLDFLAATDGGKEESRRYFNCVTPFNTKNFEANLAMARDWAARGRRAGGRRVPGTSRGKEYYLGTREGNG